MRRKQVVALAAVFIVAGCRERMELATVAPPRPPVDPIDVAVRVSMPGYRTKEETHFVESDSDGWARADFVLERAQ